MAGCLEVLVRTSERSFIGKEDMKVVDVREQDTWEDTEEEFFNS